MENLTLREFSVCEFFLDGEYEYATRFVAGDQAMLMFERCIKSPMALLGIVQRVILTDGGDCINMEWEFGKGITYPLKN